MRVSNKPRQRPETACVPVGAACAGVAVAPLWALSSVIKPGFHCHLGENKRGSFRGHLAISIPYSHDPSTPLLEACLCMCHRRLHVSCISVLCACAETTYRRPSQGSPPVHAARWDRGRAEKIIYFFGTVVSNAIVSWLIPSKRIVFFYLSTNQSITCHRRSEAHVFGQCRVGGFDHGY